MHSGHWLRIRLEFFRQFFPSDCRHFIESLDIPFREQLEIKEAIVKGKKGITAVEVRVPFGTLFPERVGGNDASITLARYVLPLLDKIEEKSDIFLREHKLRAAPIVAMEPLPKITSAGQRLTAMPDPPKLECPMCKYLNEQPKELAQHLIALHCCPESEAWFLAGQENERLYPRFRAPNGKFSVLRVSQKVPFGEIIGHYSKPDDAISIASSEAKHSDCRIVVCDDAGREISATPDE